MNLNTQTVTFIMISKEDLENLTTTLNELKLIVSEQNHKACNSEWLDSETVRLTLGVSKTTWQNYRDQRLLPFVQIGKKIFIKREDLDNFMMKHYVPARA